MGHGIALRLGYSLAPDRRLGRCRLANLLRGLGVSLGLACEVTGFNLAVSAIEVLVADWFDAHHVAGYMNRECVI